MTERRGIYFIPTPTSCELCCDDFSHDAGTVMYDAAINTYVGRPWACICEACFVKTGGRLGLGLGQKYVLWADNKFWQAEGGSYGTS